LLSRGGLTAGQTLYLERASVDTLFLQAVALCPVLATLELHARVARAAHLPELLALLPGVRTLAVPHCMFAPPGRAVPAAGETRVRRLQLPVARNMTWSAATAQALHRLTFLDVCYADSHCVAGLLRQLSHLSALRHVRLAWWWGLFFLI
jgi:hypothetical protein